MRSLLTAIVVSSTLGLVLGITINSASAQDTPPKPQRVSDFPDLVTGLKQTPGCLGVEPVAAKGGKQFIIIAWFKDKKSVEAWYYSAMHREAMAKFFPGQGSGRKPLEGIKYPNTPVMVMASVTPSDKPVEGQGLAVSQIAIELYTSLPGGAALGSRFAPEAFPAPGLLKLGK
ncbi:MAG: antibiotic biosynthesis monooxygenase [Fimbriimonas sp.]